MPSVDAEVKRDAVNVQAALRRLGDGRERVTYRGARSDPRFDKLAAKAFKEGVVLRAQSFTSTSNSELKALEFGDRYFFVIRGRSAANVDGFYHEAEGEFLFPASTNFRIVRIEQRPGGQMLIELAETTDPADFLFSLGMRT
jgi:hypothetical protein